MPSGPKKRKAAKRKNQKMAVEIRQVETPEDPNPNAGFLTPMQTPPPQVNGRDQREDEGDERFETPRFQLERLSMPETPYYSMENVKSGRRGGEIAGFRDVNALIDERFKGLDAEIPSKDEERLKEMKLEESAIVASEIPFDEGLKEVKLDEFLHSTEEKSSNEKEAVESVDVLSLNEKKVRTEASKVMESSKADQAMLEKLDKVVPVDEERIPNDSVEAVDVLSSNEDEVKTEASKVKESSQAEEAMLEKLENLDKFANVDEERIPNDSVLAVDVLSSNEREVKTEALAREPILADYGNIDGDDLLFDEERELHLDKREDVKLDEFLHSTEEKSSKPEEAMLEKLENLDKFFPVNEERIPNGSVEAVDVLSLDEKEIKSEALTSELILADCGEMDGDDEDNFESEGFIKFRRNMTRELSRDKPILADNGDLINDDDVLFDEEQEVRLDKGKDGEFDLISENYNDEVDSVPGKLLQVDLDLTINKLEKSVEESSMPVENSAFNTEEPHQEYAAVSHVKTIEAAPRNEVARGPVVARHATLWNCCGLLEVFMSSDK